jgi:hypothetical protein
MKRDVTEVLPSSVDVGYVFYLMPVAGLCLSSK